MKYFFYDTCSLINQCGQMFNDPTIGQEKVILVSSISLKELESIKTSAFKDQDIKYKARKAIAALSQNRDKYEVLHYDNNWESERLSYPCLSDNNDSKIILTAKLFMEDMNLEDTVIFVTEDLCCQELASSLGLTVEYDFVEEDSYCGYTEVYCANDNQMADCYTDIWDKTKNPFNLNINEYLLIKDSDGKIVDQYKYTSEGHVQIPSFISFSSRMFGETKPKDKYQLIAMDSLKSNTITVLRGAAGTGKSYLALTYLFHLLEKGSIDRILIFCNTVATAGSAKLGFYPGTKDEKLLDAQIGNFLSSKIGDKFEVERLIDDGKLILLPMSDVRGYDSTGMRAGVYITEAQNMDIELMRLALQRIGEDSICILDGDSEAQVDLGVYAGRNNGLRRVSEVFRGEDIYGEITLPNIYRSKIARIAQKM